MGEAEATARSDFPGVNEHELAARWCSQGCPVRGKEQRGEELPRVKNQDLRT